jgi:gamma-glutamyltranspeptidase/glutathione hydrolase
MSAKNKPGGMGGGLVPGTYPPPEAMRPTLVGERWSVVGGHPRTSLVAAQIFEAGGNAVDAGVAAGLAGNVVQVDMSNFGGIAPILVRPANHPVAYSIAGVGRWSKTADLNEILKRYGGGLPLDGAPAIVPGAPAGWLRALEQFGTMSFAEVAAPAIKLAREGFALDHRSAESLEITGRGYARWPSSAAIYQPLGRPMLEGERLKQEQLGNLLQALADAESRESGSRERGIRAAHRAFYRGDVAHEITTWVREHGGYLTEEDLADFEAEVEVAPAIDFAGWRMHATPAWSQGPVALEILGILRRTGGSWHEIADAITLAFNDREDFFAAPGQMQRDIGEFLDRDYLASQADRIGGHALPGRPLLDNISAGGTNIGSTTAVVTMDASGCTFAASPSDTLDGGPIIPSLGIMCSPRGVQSRLNTAHPNKMVPWGRPMVTPAALIGISAAESWALACPGGDVIVQAIAQVALRMSQGLSPQEAVEAPRIAAFNAPSAFHPHPSADRLVYAESRIGKAKIEQLRSQGHRVEEWPDFEFDAGSVQTIVSNSGPAGERLMLAAADPRRSAYAMAN